VLDPRNAFIMTTLMQGVVRYGTAAAASSLGRSDIAGKTGTTNDYRDAWFAGYNPDRVAIAWIGFDQPQSMGSGETGGKAALPIWMRYMSTALRGVPVRGYSVPEGVVVLNVDPVSGRRDEAGRPEFFFQEFTPARGPSRSEESGDMPVEEAPVMEAPAMEEPAANEPAAKGPDAT
jgi:penicillin-binding protein 1A